MFWGSGLSRRSWAMTWTTLPINSSLDTRDGPKLWRARHTESEFAPWCRLTWYGITLYGTIDAGFTYQTHGAPLVERGFWCRRLEICTEVGCLHRRLLVGFNGGLSNSLFVNDNVATTAGLRFRY